MGGPAAFMSYARFNDQHDDGQLTQFRERLAAEVRAQTGAEFPIFQDRNDIAWGQNWRRRIDETLDEVTLLLVIVTPSLFRSAACREEVARFREREKEFDRSDLILPVHYIGAREIDDADLRIGDDLATVLASRQFADWRELRFEPFTSPVVRRAIAGLAGRMKDTFWHPAIVSGDGVTGRGSSVPSLSGAGTRLPAASHSLASGDGREPGAVAKTEPPTHVVDPYGRGDFTTVRAAIRAAAAGDRILVRRGLYEEGLTVDKPLEILGDGPVDDIVIRSRGTDTLLFRASIGRVANLTLQQGGGKGDWYTVDITQGRLDLEGCDITSQSLACVAVHDGADPRIRRNRIHDGRTGGVFIYQGGLGTVEDNDITANMLAGVAIKTQGNPTIRRNQIHDGKECGILVSEGGLGTVEDNDITANALAGMEIKTKGNPTVRRNRIDQNEYQAVWIHSGGLGVIENNDLTGNRHGAMRIESDCVAGVRRSQNTE